MTIIYTLTKRNVTRQLCLEMLRKGVKSAREECVSVQSLWSAITLESNLATWGKVKHLGPFLGLYFRKILIFAQENTGQNIKLSYHK